MSKVCSRCNTPKPTEAFHRLAKSPDGLRAACKECRQTESRLNHVRNRERINKCSAEWRHNNHERHLELIRRWAAANLERKREGVRRYRREHPEQMREREMRPERREHHRFNQMRQRARRKTAQASGFISAKEWRQVQADYSGLCVYCNCAPAKLTMDHIEPLSGGGAHNAENVVPSCKSCNCSKNYKSLLRFLVDRRVAA